MTFGCGAGDILAISQLAEKVYTAYRDAPGDYRNISDEVKSLHIIIKKAAQHFESTTLSTSSRQEGQEVLKGCQNVLVDLDSLTNKYNSLASASTGQVLQRIKLGTEDIATLRARLTSNTTLLSSFIQSCEFHKLDRIQARLDNVLGLHRTLSIDSIISFAGSINTKKAYKRFCKGLFEIGVTADMISEKAKEIQDIFKPQHPKPQHPVPSNQTDDSTFVSKSQLPEVGNSSDVETSPTPMVPTERKGPRPRSRFQPPIDFLVGPLMLAAAEAGNTKRLISALEYVRNINFGDVLKQTALHWAAAKGHKDAVQLLLTKGASIEAMDKDNSTPLHYAALNGHTNIVELLISRGASIDAMDESGGTPLHFAAWEGHTSTVDLLLSKGASIGVVATKNNTPLHLAAWEGHTGIVELLLSRGASIEVMANRNNTPLHFAAWNGHSSTVELLLSKGAPIGAMNIHNNTPLHLAAWMGHCSAVELLLSKGAPIGAMNVYNNTPLHLSALVGHSSTVELLLTKGAPIEAANKATKTPLYLAIENGHTNAAKLLETKAAELVSLGNIRTTSG